MTRHGSASDPGALVRRGATWSTLYQAFDAVVSLASMLVLVRIIPPADYGRAAAAAGVLIFLNTFNAHIFMSYALQLPEGEEPPWRLHWSVGFYLHGTLAVLAQAIAIGFWFVPDYRAVAPLMHLGGLGILLDWPAQLAAVILRRRLDLRRLHLLSAAGTVLRLTTTMGLALAGAGAYGIVVGTNVVSGLPFAVDLLVVQRWRPGTGWWKAPDWREYRRPLAFGFQRIGGVVVGGVRGLLEAAVLPMTIGYDAIGLLNRARALYGATLGRVGSAIVETAYPFLPRAAADRTAYARGATLFVQVLLLVAVPGGLYLGVEGRAVSRVLYGEKWVAMDPLIWPGVITGVALAVFAGFSAVLVAAGRVRTVLWLDALAGLLTITGLWAAWATSNPVAYAWALTSAEIVVVIAAARTMSPLMQAGWWSSVCAPPLAAGGLAAAVLLVGRPLVAELSMPLRLGETAIAFAAVAVGTLLVAFPRAVSPLVAVLRPPAADPGLRSPLASSDATFGGPTEARRARVGGAAS
jgi:PST family polysaccharide transporter